jgi:hypothetical protein
MSALTPRMTLISSRIAELEAVAFQLGVHDALVAAWPLGEDSIKRS